MNQQTLTLGLVIASLIFLTGCAARPLQVPDDARLLFYGPATSYRGQAPPQPGQVYLFNESRNRIESVLSVTGEQNFSFGGLNPKNRYRIYFRADDIVAPPAPPAPERPPVAERDAE